MTFAFVLINSLKIFMNYKYCILEGYEYTWQTKKHQVRPGLNVFDEKGIELDWDYEHDTRFFDKIIANEEEGTSTKNSDETWDNKSNFYK